MRICRRLNSYPERIAKQTQEDLHEKVALEGQVVHPGPKNGLVTVQRLIQPLGNVLTIGHTSQRHLRCQAKEDMAQKFFSWASMLCAPPNPVLEAPTWWRGQRHQGPTPWHLPMEGNKL
jgi:hypothetical protein